MRFTLVFAMLMLSANSAFARERENPGLNQGPFVCENGRTYESRKGMVYVDGILAANGVRYAYRTHSYGVITLLENGFISTHCELANPPPPPAPSKRYDNYVKVCDPDCRWETREIQ